MRLPILPLVLALALAAIAAPGAAAPCKDGKGGFVKCGTPGARPM